MNAPLGPDADRPVRSTPARRRRVAWIGGLLVSVLALLYASSVEPYHFVGDDGGITLRYAERIAAGRGFSYNDGERVNGCSNPLYTLALAAQLRGGLEAGPAVKVLAALGFAGALGLLFAGFARFYSASAGALVAVLAAAYSRPFEMLYDGLEVPFVWLLAALLFFCAHLRSEWPAGVALGLLVANKLDAGLAAVSYAAVYTALRRRLPIRAATGAVLTVLPMVVLLVISFGSPVPHSMVMKVSDRFLVSSFVPSWMHTQLLNACFATYVTALATLPISLLLRSPGRLFAVRVVQVWFAVHLFTYASVDLGDTHPWYAAVPQVLALILAGFAVHALPRVDWTTRPRLQLREVPGARGWLVAALLAGALLWIKGPEIPARTRLAPGEQGLPLYASGNLARQAAGAWLRTHTSGAEWLVSAYGLPAFEYGGPFLDPSGLNSPPDVERTRTAAYALVGPKAPAGEPPSRRAGRSLVGVFQYDAAAPRYFLYAAPTSEVVRARVHHLAPGALAPGDLATGSYAEGVFAPLPSSAFKLLCSRWRDRIDRVAAGALPENATWR